MAKRVFDPVIYNIRNLINNKIYIGSAIECNKRKREHFNSLSKGTHGNQHLQSAWNKYGRENFVFEVIEFLPIQCDLHLMRDTLIKREQIWLDYFRPEYNIQKVAGSPLGTKHSEETKRLMSEKAKLRRHSEETKRKIGIISSTRKFSAESRKKMSDSQKLRNLLNPPPPRSQESRDKISKANKGKIPWNKGKEYSEETKRKISQNRDYNYNARIKQSTTNRINTFMRKMNKYWTEKFDIDNSSLYFPLYSKSNELNKITKKFINGFEKQSLIKFGEIK